MLRMTFGHSTMAFFAGRLTSIFHSGNTPVIDRTQLVGEFDFRFQCPAPRFQIPIGIAPQGNAQLPADAADPEVGLANLSGLLGKQLGLKLDTTKAAVDYIVVDRINKVPTDN